MGSISQHTTTSRREDRIEFPLAVNCHFCLQPFSSEVGYVVCRNRRRQHFFCGNCIQQYIDHFLEDESWPILKGRSNGSYTLPCLLNGQDDDVESYRHYLSLTTIQRSIEPDKWERFKTKMERIASLKAALEGAPISKPIKDAAAIKVKVDMSSKQSKSTALSSHSDVSTKRPSLNGHQPQTCECCFEVVVPCLYTEYGFRCDGELHFFCRTCIRKYVEEWLYGSSMCGFHLQPTSDNGWALPCLANHTGDRPHFLPGLAVELCVSAQVYRHYCQKIETILQAKPSSVAVLEAGQQQEQIDGDNANASSSSSKQEHYYHQAAEALTEAMMRRCPSCHTQFFKDADSCNKVRCPHCRTIMCYVCRQTLPANAGYQHFCHHRARNESRCHQSCGKCPLWRAMDQQTKQDEERRQNIARDVANRAWEELLLSGDNDGAQVQQNIDRLL